MTKVKKGMRAVGTEDMDGLLASMIAPQLDVLLQHRSPGHCVRVTDLNAHLATLTCSTLHAGQPGVEAYVLVDEHHSLGDQPYAVTGTRLVELRNPLPDGSLRPPLLIFIPAGLHASAEDSFSVATFEHAELPSLYDHARDELLARFPPDVRALTESVLTLNESKPGKVDVVRYLLTIALNDHDPSVVGAALYELNLLPDFNIHHAGAELALRLRQNLTKANVILDQSKSERSRALSVGVTDRTFRQHIANSLLDAKKDGPKSWLRSIAMDQAMWPLAFDKWPLPDAVAQDKIYIEITGSSLPIAVEGMPGLQADEPYLPIGDGSVKKFKIDFKTSPAPNQIPKISKFVLEIISQEQGPVGVLTSRKAWPKGDKAYAEFALTKLARAEWGSGLHYVRIRPYAADGTIIDLVDEDGAKLPWGGSQEKEGETYPNELWFFVSSDAEPDEAPPQRAIQRLPSLAAAWVQLKATESVQQRKRPVALERVTYNGDENVFEVSFGKDGLRHIPAPASLAELERHVMATAPEQRQSALTVRPKQRTYALGDDPVPAHAISSATRQYLDERRAFLECVRGADGTGLVSALDPLRNDIEVRVLAYAQAYQDALKSLCERSDTEARIELRHLLTWDTVRTTIVQQGAVQDVTLIAPTHPLKVLWTATWAKLGQQWTAEPLPPEVRDLLFNQLRASSFPALGMNADGRLQVPSSELAPGWTLCTAPSERDPRGVLSDLCAGLQVKEPVGEDGLRADDLARRLRRYLIQHPYLTVLTINAFNAGQAGLIADALVQLQKFPELKDLAYDVRLFVDDPLAAGIGYGLLNLLNHSGRTTDRNAEAFGMSTGDTLRPKLGLAIRPFADFQRDIHQHHAHISVLFDAFPAGEVTAKPVQARLQAAPFHGLIQDQSSQYTETDDQARWERQPLFGAADPIDDEDGLAPLLGSLPAVVSLAMTTVATGEYQQNLLPTITLTLGSEQRTLLHQIHEVSDWVITVDRNLGVEFFDHGRRNRPEYLIDHASRTATGGYQLVVSSRENEELEVMLRPVLHEYGLAPERALATLTALQALSGRLALKLLSSSSDQAEVLGLALSKLFLEYQGALTNQLVIPLDTHPELNRVQDGLDLHVRRTDLALVDLDAVTRMVTIRLVEVKCYRNAGSLGFYDTLKASIAEQIRDSEVRLERVFGTSLKDPHPALPILRARNLKELLTPYLERADRYRLIDPEAYAASHALLDSLEDGYSLSFERSAIIFDFSADGHGMTSENGIEYHRVGHDAIIDLMAIAPQDRTDSVDLAMTMTATLPKLREASFQPSKRRNLPSTDLARTTVQRQDPQPSEPSTRRDELEVQPFMAVTPAGDSLTAHEPTVIVDSALIQDDTSATAVNVTGPSMPEQDTAPKLVPTHRTQYDVLLGTSKDSPQFGLLGEIAGRKVALDLNETHTISLFGVQGGGKSYTLGSIVEMATIPIPGINELPAPLATVIFHYSNTQEYAPEFVSMREANTEAQQLEQLAARYGAVGQALSDIVLLTPEDKLEDRKREYPGLNVQPLLFAASELQVSHWKFLMNAVGNTSTYIRQLTAIMREHRKDLKVSILREAIETSALPSGSKELALSRLQLAGQYIDDSAHLSSLIQPGRLIIVDLRDEFIEKSEALGLFVVLLQLFADARIDGNPFNKLVVFDEAHKYISDPELVKNLVEVIREMRHKGTSIMIASQDPPSVPIEVIELSSQVILHKFNSPAWLRHIQKANAALANLTPTLMAELKPGEAYIWSSKSTDSVFASRAMKVQGRPRVSKHGGDTKKAIS